MKYLSIYGISMLMATTILLNGCASRPAEFYSLTPLAKPGSRTTEKQNPWLIGLGPINLAKYLQRKQIVSHVQNNQVTIEEFKRWAGDLDDNINYVIIENLAALFDTRGIVPYPWSESIDLDYQIEVQVNYFTVDSRNNLKLIAMWSLIDPRNNRLVHFERSEIIKQVNDSNMSAQIDAQNQALLELSQAMAKKLRALALQNIKP